MSAIISHSRKFIFPHIPRTAGTSLTKYLKHFLSAEDEIENGRIEKHMPLSKIRSVIGEEKFKDYFKFAVVRNPFDRLQSIWEIRREDFRGHLIDFLYELEFINDDLVKPLSHWLWDGDILFDSVARLESLETDLVDIFQKIDVPFGTLEHLNKTHRVKTDFSAEEKQLIRKYYQWDFDQFYIHLS